jgi:hypothetical protein
MGKLTSFRSKSPAQNERKRIKHVKSHKVRKRNEKCVKESKITEKNQK